MSKTVSISSLSREFGKTGSLTGEGSGAEKLASPALTALEPEALRLGAREIGLHVFSHNQSAIRLYERPGYDRGRESEGGPQMTKSLA